MKTITVTVTEDHIEAARNQKAQTSRVDAYIPTRCCPIARALREIPGLEAASVSCRHFAPSQVAGIIHEAPDAILLPEEARQFVEQFDSMLPVQPFAFIITLP